MIPTVSRITFFEISLGFLTRIGLISYNILAFLYLHSDSIQIVDEVKVAPLPSSFLFHELKTQKRWL